MIPVQIDDRFVIPPSVATAMLCNPANRLSNKSRKRAMFARAKRIISLAPIVQDGPHAWLYDPAQRTPESKLARRYSALPLQKLARLPRRCIKLRAQLQRAYESTKPEQERVRQQINLAVARTELMLDCATAEIKRRSRNIKL
jgi:hypothetical protein